MGRGKPKGNVHAPKTTQQQMVTAKKLTAKQVKSVQEFRPDDSDDELKVIADSRGESDDDDEEEVFDLEGEEESDNEVNQQHCEPYLFMRNDETMVLFLEIYIRINL